MNKLKKFMCYVGLVIIEAVIFFVIITQFHGDDEVYINLQGEYDRAKAEAQLYGLTETNQPEIYEELSNIQNSILSKKDPITTYNKIRDVYGEIRTVVE